MEYFLLLILTHCILKKIFSAWMNRPWIVAFYNCICILSTLYTNKKLVLEYNIMRFSNNLTMNLLFISVNLSIIYLVSCTALSDTKMKMEEHGIIPDVLDKTPNQKLEVFYKDLQVNLGNELTPLQVKDQPEVKWQGDEKSFYTLLMVDPDAPSRNSPTLGEVRHWFVGNIKGSDLKTGEEISAYVGSGPPKGTGLHRYIFLLYKQEQGRIDFNEPKTLAASRAHRLKFKTREFVNKYNLGDPIAGNFFQAQWDDYVEIRNKNITN